MLFLITLMVVPGVIDCGSDVALPELEFLVGEMSYAECQQLADALRSDFGGKNSEEGVTCLDDLLRHNSQLESEGSNIARGIFKHKLNQIGRRDLAEWLSIGREPMIRSRPRNGFPERNEAGEKTAPKGAGLEDVKAKAPKSWCEIAVTIALLYTAGLLIWLTVRILLCRMKRELRTRGVTGNGLYGYSYYPTRMEEPPANPPRPSASVPPMTYPGYPHHHYYDYQQSPPVYPIPTNSGSSHKMETQYQ